MYNIYLFLFFFLLFSMSQTKVLITSERYCNFITYDDVLGFIKKWTRIFLKWKRKSKNDFFYHLNFTNKKKHYTNLICKMTNISLSKFIRKKKKKSFLNTIYVKCQLYKSKKENGSALMFFLNLAFCTI